MQVETVVVRVTVAETVLVDVPGPIGMTAPTDLPVAHRARSPTNEHAELGIPEPVHPGVALLGGLVDLRHLAEINHLVFVGLGLNGRHGSGNGADRTFLAGRDNAEWCEAKGQRERRAGSPEGDSPSGRSYFRLAWKSHGWTGRRSSAVRSATAGAASQMAYASWTGH